MGVKSAAFRLASRPDGGFVNQRGEFFQLSAPFPNPEPQRFCAVKAWKPARARGFYRKRPNIPKPRKAGVEARELARRDVAEKFKGNVELIPGHPPETSKIPQTIHTTSHFVCNALWKRHADEGTNGEIIFHIHATSFIANTKKNRVICILPALLFALYSILYYMIKHFGETRKS
jgi:hypothetical protein